MATRQQTATARIDSITIERIEVTGYGDPQPYYVNGKAHASGQIALADRSTLALRTPLTMEEQAALMDLCDAIEARVLRELAEGF